MKIKEQTRKLAAGCSKHCFEVIDKTEEVSSKHGFEVVDEEAGKKVFGIRKTHSIRYWKTLMLCVLLWGYLLHFLLKLSFCPASTIPTARRRWRGLKRLSKSINGCQFSLDRGRVGRDVVLPSLHTWFQVYRSCSRGRLKCHREV